MRRLGWEPRLTPLDVSGALGSVADGLTKIAAKARRLARAHSALAEELTAAAMLNEMRGQLTGALAAPGASR